MLIKKQDIKQLPLQELKLKNTEEVQLWCEQWQLSHHHTWVLPQMVAHFGMWTLVRVDGKIDALNTLKHNVGDDAWQIGLWKLSRIKRSQLVASQVKAPEYAQFTPLVLAGFKRMQNVTYESWRGAVGLEHILEPDIYNAIVLDDYSCCTLGSERLLEIRAQGLKIMSGAKVGQMKSAESTWSLTGIKDTELGGTPKLTQTMLTQCWLAHPKHRTHLMVLDPQNWDRMPEPLVSTEIFAKPETLAVPKQNTTDSTKLPWL